MQGQELDLMILMRAFQLSLFYNSMTESTSSQSKKSQSKNSQTVTRCNTRMQFSSTNSGRDSYKSYSHLWRATAKQGCPAVHKQCCVDFLLTVTTMVSSFCHAMVPSHQKKSVIPQVIHQGPIIKKRKVNSPLGKGPTSLGGRGHLPSKTACTTEVKSTKGCEQN